MSLPIHRLRLAPVSVAVYLLVFAFSIDRGTHVEAFAARRAPQLSHRASRRDTATSHRRLSDDDGDGNPRDDFGRALRGVQSSALKTNVEVGDTVVCKRAVERLNIYENASYEVTSIYTQRFDEETQRSVREPLRSLGDAATVDPGNAVYLKLFSPEHHAEAVVVTPAEVGLVTVREELANAAWLAVPGFFWIVVAYSFYNIYHERTGGSFGDAFFGR